MNRFAKNYSVCYANFYCNFRHAKLIKVYKEKKIHHHHRHEYKSSKNSTVQTVLKESRLQLTFMTSSLVTFFSCETNNNFDMMGGRTAFFPSKPWGKDNKRICHFFLLFQASIWLLQSNTRKKMSFGNRYAFRVIEMWDVVVADKNLRNSRVQRRGNIIQKVVFLTFRF